MAHRFSSNTSPLNAAVGTSIPSNLQVNSQHSVGSYRRKEVHVTIIDPIHEKEQRKELRSILKPPMISNDDFIQGKIIYSRILLNT
ncbi:unnamed protein product [Rotaria magnacalcarata]